MLAAKKKEETYVALFYQLLSTDDLSQNADHWTARCNALQAKESEIFSAIQDLKKVFSEILSDSLNMYNQMKHLIDLMKNKMSCIESIYKMTQDELAVTIVSLTTQDIYRDQTVITITRLEIWR